VRIGAVQLNSSDDTERNLATADRLVRDAAGRGATLVVLPEKWTVLGTDEHLRAGRQPLDGPAMGWASATAKELGIDLIAGSIVEHVEGDEKTANTSVHFGPDGARRAVYRKLHMFDVEVDGTVYAESANERPGSEIVATELGDGTVLGMSICYDLRFAEMYRVLAAERGAEVISVPSAFTLATTRDHWEILVRARAIENQCYVVAANQVGDHPGGYRSGGRSLIVDPWGIVLAQAHDEETVIVAEIDKARLRDIRAKLPSLANRQADAYRWPARI
jgi:predicted amidohydrolase